jgi:hypothetical protein
MKYIVIIEHSLGEWYVADTTMIMTAREFQEFKEAYEVFVKYRSSVQEEDVSDCDIFGDELYSGDEEHDTAMRFWLKYKHYLEVGDGDDLDICGVKYITTEDKDFIDL